MKRILLRSKKDPFELVTPGEVIQKNLFGNNAGNLIFSEAAHKLLTTADTEVVANRFRADPKDADRINEEYDAFVVPLANAFRLSFEQNLISLTRLIERLRIPVVVLGVGAQSGLDYNLERLRRIDGSVKKFAAAVLDRSPSIGVRGEFTQMYLNSLGFKDVEVIGCPSMFMNGEDLRVEKAVPTLDGDSAIAISASRSALRAGDVGSIVMANYDRYPNMTYFAQETVDLELLYWGDASETVNRNDPMPIHRTHPLFREDRVRVYLDPTTWIEDLRDYDFAFGTRIHGTIAALLAGIPGVVLCHDSRTLELCRYFDIPHEPIPDLPLDVDAAKLYEEADYSALHSGHKERFGRFTSFLAAHGLDHVFAEGGDNGAAFEARRSATDFPPGVGSWTTGGGNDVGSRIGWLKENQARSEQRIAELAEKVAKLEKRTKRVDRPERAEPAEPTGLYRTARRALVRFLNTGVHRRS